MKRQSVGFPFLRHNHFARKSFCQEKKGQNDLGAK
jgi:hypothetical protein